MLKNLKKLMRLLVDPTMFKYHKDYMEYISAKPCGKCYGNSFSNDLIILFDEKCQYCMNIDKDECKYKQDNFNFDTIIFNLYNRLLNIKNLKFNYKIILAFYVNSKKYLSYEDFYHNFLLRFKHLFVADYIILYGLKKNKIKVLKCTDNISIGVSYNPKFTKESNCTIEGE